MSSCFRPLLALIGFEVRHELSNYGQEKVYEYLQLLQKFTPPQKLSCDPCGGRAVYNVITEHEL